MSIDNKRDMKPHHRGRLSTNADVVLAKLKAGSTYTAVAKEYGVAVPSVFYFAQRNGIMRKSEATTTSKLSKTILQEIASLEKLISVANGAQTKIDALRGALLALSEKGIV